jgi:hypothetical protein
MRFPASLGPSLTFRGQAPSFFDSALSRTVYPGGLQIPFMDSVGEINALFVGNVELCHIVVPFDHLGLTERVIYRCN